LAANKFIDLAAKVLPNPAICHDNRTVIVRRTRSMPCRKSIQYPSGEPVMKTQSARNYTLFTLILTALAGAGCQSQPPAPAPEVSAVATANVTVSPDVPADVPGGAPAATLTAAAEFAPYIMPIPENQPLDTRIM
jgi:hypothetical protein